MNPKVRFGQLEVEAKLRDQLMRLDATPQHTAQDSESQQSRAQELLARVTWSRLIEPGDGVAGSLVKALGAVASLTLLIQGVSASELRTVAKQAGVDLGKETSLALKRWLPRLNRDQTLDDIERAHQTGLHVLLPGDPSWPEQLADLGVHEPLMLWVRGDAQYLATDSASIVGARAVTDYGTHITAEIVEGLSLAGLTIVSGAAYGVDAVAHRTALALETPTVAVLAGGADRSYPAAHDQLLQRIRTLGVVCSEMIPGSAPTRWRFLQRNRIIAALSTGTLVTEAGLRSGTINTAGHAATLGRLLGAVPGPVTSAASAGCHRLIREYGAELITSAKDMLDMMGVEPDAHLLKHAHAVASNSTTSATRELSAHRRIIDALPLRGRRNATEIARRAGLSVEEASNALAELQLLGRVRYEESPRSVAPEWSLIRTE